MPARALERVGNERWVADLMKQMDRLSGNLIVYECDENGDRVGYGFSCLLDLAQNWASLNNGIRNLI